MEKLKITNIFRTDKDKHGNPLKTRDGRDYSRCSIKTVEHGEKWISGFGGNASDQWREGDVVNVAVEQKGEWLNWSIPKQADAASGQILAISNAISALEKRVAALEVCQVIDPQSSVPITRAELVPDEDLGDIPF